MVRRDASPPSSGADPSLPPLHFEAVADDIPPAPESDHEDDEIHAPENPINQDFVITEEDEAEEPLFDPPLYIQRYCFVEEMIDKYSSEFDFKSVADLGCAEMKFLVRCKNGRRFGRIIGVDTDEFLIGGYSRRIQPGAFEFQRNSPLKMEVYAGNATQPDARLVGVDVITAIELIEHMDPKDHRALEENVFDVIQPKLAIFSTPNVEYNPLFPNGSVDQKRHWDHRFEWNREEFQSWAKKVVERFPAYRVEFGGVGAGPEGTESSHGFCSQVAVFVRNPAFPVAKRRVLSEPYKLMVAVDYPWEPPKTPFETLLTVLDAECYEYATSLLEKAEEQGRFWEEYFTFKVEDLYKARWKLMDLFPEDQIGEVRRALKTLQKDWLKYDEEKDEVTYRLEQPKNEFEDEDDPNLDMEAECTEHPAAYGSVTAQVWEELQDENDWGENGGWGEEENGDDSWYDNVEEDWG